MKPEQKIKMAEVQDYVKIGVPEEIVPMIQKLGFLTIEDLKKANVNKLFNDLGGMRKKMKLEVKLPSKEEVEKWVS
jgi:lysyl-tRNA synthetase class 2